MDFTGWPVFKNVSKFAGKNNLDDPPFALSAILSAKVSTSSGLLYLSDP
jgi:hypothetical protein